MERLGRILTLGTGALILLFGVGCAGETARQDTSPHVILILADDMGYGDVSILNENAGFRTVNLDRLAENGAIFTNAHSSSAVCTPTRYGILTGRYAWRTSLKSGVLTGYSPPLIPEDQPTLPGLLKRAGYVTAFIGKWHLGWDWSFVDPENVSFRMDATPEVDFTQPVRNGPTSRGFDYSFGISGSLDMPPYVYVENDIPTMVPTRSTVSTDFKGFWRKGPTSEDFDHARVLQDITDKATRFITENARREEPFFLYFALPAPHTPILPTAQFIGKSNTNFYGDFVLQVDDVVGQIMAVLEREQIAGKTLVLFTADNGCSPRAGFDELLQAGHNPNYHFRGSKADIYEGGHRVPFIAHLPGTIPPGLTSTALVSTTDLVATCADLTGTELGPGEGVDSFSFWSQLMGESPAESRQAVVLHSIDGRFAIRQGDWKLILWPGSGGWSSPRTGEELAGLPPCQLYHLGTDPGERNNLCEEHPDRVNELRELLSRYILDGRSTPGEKQANDSLDDWPQIDWMALPALGQ